jgi:hypothetical protein
MIVEEMFLVAVNTYKDWWECGRDFNLHADKFEAWNQAVIDFASAAGVDRGEAIIQVRTVLGMSNTR